MRVLSVLLLAVCTSLSAKQPLSVASLDNALVVHPDDSFAMESLENLLWDNTDIDCGAYFMPCFELAQMPEGKRLFHSADDFIIPAFTSWTIKHVLIRKYEDPTTTEHADSIGLIIYSDDNNKPNEILYRANFKKSFTPGGENLNLELPTPVDLETGRYWSAE